MDPFTRHTPSGQRSPNDELVTTQDSLERVLGEFTRREQNDSHLIFDLILTAGYENNIEHGLGKVVRGWKLVDVRDAAVIWRIADTEADQSKYLVLATTTDTIVSLEVF